MARFVLKVVKVVKVVKNQPPESRGGLKVVNAKVVKVVNPPGVRHTSLR
jgi:hypothetical protein